MPPRGTNSYPLRVNGILLVNESYFLGIVVVGRFLVTIFGKELLHLFLLLRGKMSLATMHTIIGGAVAHNIHHCELEGMHIAMSHLVVEMGESQAALNCRTRLKWVQGPWRLASGKTALPAVTSSGLNFAEMNRMHSWVRGQSALKQYIQL